MTIPCAVYRSSGREFTYLYVHADQDYDELPTGLREQFGEAEKIMDLELSPSRQLAQEDVLIVMENLERNGYHLQLPPRDDPSGWLDLPDP